jgi:hypothetical protein
MACDLKEIKERIQFCRGEIETLAKEQQSYLDQNFERRAVQVNGRREIQARLLTEVPANIRSRAGMIANELRDILI